MKYAADFRKIAREALYEKWKLVAFVCLITVLLGGAGAEGLRLELEIEDTWAKAVVEFAGVTVGSFGGGRSSVIGAFLLNYGTMILTGTMILGIFQLLLGSIIELGHTRFHLKLIDRCDAGIKDLFSYFYIWKKAITATFLQILYILFWMILFVIPGIIALFDYSMTSYILAEHPELSASEAIKRSKQIMKGNRWRLFCLELSFIGWSILCAFTLGIGQLFLIPYRKTAIAAFYREISGTWDMSVAYTDANREEQKSGVIGITIIFLVLLILGGLLIYEGKRQDKENAEYKQLTLEQVLQEYEDEILYLRWKYDVDLEKENLTADVIERINWAISIDDCNEEFDFSGLMSEIALLMNDDDRITVYQEYGPLKGYFIKNVPTGGAFSESSAIEIRKGQNIADIQLNQGMELDCNCNGNGPSDGTLLADGRKATHKTYYKVLYGTILFSEDKGYFIDENTVCLVDKNLLSSVGIPSYAEVGNQVLSFESPYELQVAIEEHPTDFIADEGVEIFSKAFWNNVNRIEYYEGSDIPFVVTNETVIQEIGRLIADLEYQKAKTSMYEGGWFFDIYTEDGMYYSVWISNGIINFNGIEYEVPTTMLGDSIRMLVMDNYDRNIQVEEYVVNDYRINILDSGRETDTPINIKIQFLTDKEKHILQNTIDVESKYEYTELDVKVIDDTERTKAVNIKVDDYELSFKFDAKTYEVFDIQ